MFSNYPLLVLRRSMGITLNVNQFPKSQFRKFSESCVSSVGTEHIQTINEVKEKLRKIMGVEQGYHPMQKSRSDYLSLLPSSQDELPPRSIKDSYDEALIPLGSDVALQDKYVTFMGNIRYGRLMEDLDIFAVHIIFKHLLIPKQKEGDVSPVVVATILVDEIIVNQVPTKYNEDIRIHGNVSWVGSSSGEVTVWLEQYIHGTWVQTLRALFLMVTRNSTNTKSTFLNKLVPANDEEKKVVTEAEARAKQRKKEVLTSLLKEPPNEEEQHLIHRMFLSSCDLQDITLNRRVLPENAKWMKDTKIVTSIICQPEDRNLHNKIFGGFLMRNALELSFMTGFVHCQHRPVLRYSSGITFNHPVDVGSFLQLTGVVAYTEKQFMQITVYNEIRDPFTSKVTTSNVFHYTYEATSFVKQVIPSSYSEAMMYIDGRRNLNTSLV